MPQMMTNDPAGTGPIIEDVSNDPLYNALSYDPIKQEEYKDKKLEEISQNVINKVNEEVAEVKEFYFYKTMSPKEQQKIEALAYYTKLNEGLTKMTVRSKKGWATKDARAGSAPRYPFDEVYSDTYKNAIDNLIVQQEAIIERDGPSRREKREATAQIIKLQELAIRSDEEKLRINKILGIKNKK
jgi:uncharacterized membrane protein